MPHVSVDIPQCTFPTPYLPYPFMGDPLQPAAQALLLSTIANLLDSNALLFAENCRIAAQNSRLQGALEHSLQQCLQQHIRHH